VVIHCCVRNQEGGFCTLYMVGLQLRVGGEELRYQLGVISADKVGG
jgi:hypothetical protein